MDMERCAYPIDPTIKFDSFRKDILASLTDDSITMHDKTAKLITN